MMLWYKPQNLELRSWEPGLDEEGWEVVDDFFVPALPLENLKTKKKEITYPYFYYICKQFFRKLP